MFGIRGAGLSFWQDFDFSFRWEFSVLDLVGSTAVNAVFSISRSNEVGTDGSLTPFTGGTGTLRLR